jgi:hypothetical protein
MTEAAGLALAIFPVVVQGLNVYLDGSQKIKNLWQWKLGLRCLIRDLKAESVLFHNTCTNVLAGVFSPSEVTLLMSSESWDDQFIVDLEACWGAENASVFIDMVKHLSSTVKELRTKLKLDENMKVSILTYSPDSILIVHDSPNYLTKPPGEINGNKSSSSLKGMNR